MKKVNNCVVENCIPTPSSCVEWNGGEVEFLGVCNGTPLNTLMWEIIDKLKEIAGEDLSEFELEGLLDMCKSKAPNEVTLISILDLLRTNQICLKDYVDKLQDTVNSISKTQNVNVNLRCFAQLDNLGNALSITREALDQLVIDQLCNQKNSIDDLNSKYTLLKNAFDGLVIPSTTEPDVAICLDMVAKPTSTQLTTLSAAFCALRDATGDDDAIGIALTRTPSDWKQKVGNPLNWNDNPSTLANNYNNLLLVVNNMMGRLKMIEDNCCAITCDDVKLGFSAIYSEDGLALVLTFNNATGTKIPAGMIDKGSTGTITDRNGNVQPFILAITNNYQIEVPINGLANGELQVNIQAQIGNDALICSKCLNKTVTLAACGVCELTATGSAGAVAVIVYEDTI